MIRALRSYLFSTAENEYQRGWDFAKSSLSDDPTEDEVDCFFGGVDIPNERTPFDLGLVDYLKSIKWGKVENST